MIIQAPISIGELIDKITILEIKIDNIQDPKKLENIKCEYEHLKNIVPDALKNNEKIKILQVDLKNVNAKLWHIEDVLRLKEHNKIFDDEFVSLARSVYITNDRRAALKRDINILTGSLIVEEKSYQHY